MPKKISREHQGALAQPGLSLRHVATVGLGAQQGRNDDLEKLLDMNRHMYNHDSFEFSV